MKLVLLIERLPLISDQVTITNRIEITNQVLNTEEFSITVNAPNFGPHGNFGALFQKGLLSFKRVLQKNEENKTCRKTLDLQIRFCSFFAHHLSTEVTELARKVQSFHEVQS